MHVTETRTKGLNSPELPQIHTLKTSCYNYKTHNDWFLTRHLFCWEIYPHCKSLIFFTFTITSTHNAHSSHPYSSTNSPPTDKIDYTVSPQLITISPGAPSVVVVDTFVDGLALEEDELFTLRLELVGDTAPGLLRPSLPITLVDTDGEWAVLSYY